MYNMNSNQDPTYYNNYGFYTPMIQCNGGEEPILYQSQQQPEIHCINSENKVTNSQNYAPSNVNQYYNPTNEYSYYSTNSYNQYSYPYNYVNDQLYYNVPPKSATPDKPIMNDSGIETSPSMINISQLSSNPANSTPTTTTNKYPNNAVLKPTNDLRNLKTNDLVKVDRKSLDKKTDEAESDDNDEYSDDDDVEYKNNKNVKNKAGKGDQSLMKPPKPYLEIIADAILSCQARMMQLHEIYYYMEKKYPYFAQNVNKSWRNSVRHNLSLNECFVKAGRGTNGKGNYWKIHNLCEPDFQRGNFRRKSFKQLIRSSSQSNGNRYEYPSSMNYLTQIPNITNFQNISNFISKQNNSTMIPNINAWCNLPKII